MVRLSLSDVYTFRNCSFDEHLWLCTRFIQLPDSGVVVHNRRNEIMADKILTVFEFHTFTISTRSKGEAFKNDESMYVPVKEVVT